MSASAFTATVAGCPGDGRDRRPHGRAEVDHRLLRIVGRGDQHRRPAPRRAARRDSAPPAAGRPARLRAPGSACGSPAAGAGRGWARGSSPGDGWARWAILAGPCAASCCASAGGADGEVLRLLTHQDRRSGDGQDDAEHRRERKPRPRTAFLRDSPSARRDVGPRFRLGAAPMRSTSTGARARRVAASSARLATTGGAPDARGLVGLCARHDGGEIGRSRVPLSAFATVTGGARRRRLIVAATCTGAARRGRRAWPHPATGGAGGTSVARMAGGAAGRAADEAQAVCSGRPGEFDAAAAERPARAADGLAAARARRAVGGGRRARRRAGGGVRRRDSAFGAAAAQARGRRRGRRVGGGRASAGPSVGRTAARPARSRGRARAPRARCRCRAAAAART